MVGNFPTGNICNNDRRSWLQSMNVSGVFDVDKISGQPWATQTIKKSNSSNWLIDGWIWCHCHSKQRVINVTYTKNESPLTQWWRYFVTRANSEDEWFCRHESTAKTWQKNIWRWLISNFSPYDPFLWWRKGTAFKSWQVKTGDNLQVVAKMMLRNQVLSSAREISDNNSNADLKYSS